MFSYTAASLVSICLTWVDVCIAQDSGVPWPRLDIGDVAGTVTGAGDVLQDTVSDALQDTDITDILSGAGDVLQDTVSNALQDTDITDILGGAGDVLQDTDAIEALVNILRTTSDDGLALYAAVTGVDVSLLTTAAGIVRSLSDAQVAALESAIVSILSNNTVPVSDLLIVFNLTTAPLDDFDFDYFLDEMRSLISDPQAKQLVDALPIDDIINGADFNGVFVNGQLDIAKLQTAIATLRLDLIPLDELQLIAQAIDWIKLYENSEISSVIPSSELITSMKFVHGLYLVALLKQRSSLIPELAFLTANNPFRFWSCFASSFALDDRDLTAIAAGGEGADCTAFNTTCSAQWMGIMDSLISSTATSGITVGCPAMKECMERFSFPCFVENAPKSASAIEVGIQKGIADTMSCVLVGSVDQNAQQLEVFFQSIAESLFGPEYVKASQDHLGIVPELMYSADIYTEVQEKCIVRSTGEYQKHTVELTMAVRKVLEEDTFNGYKLNSLTSQLKIASRQSESFINGFLFSDAPRAIASLALCVVSSLVMALISI